MSTTDGDDAPCCTICLEALPPFSATTIATLDCGHAFHATCLVGWLRRGTVNCPTCRTSAVAREHVPPLALRARASYLRRTVARRREAPAELLRLVRQVQQAEEQYRARAHDERAFVRAHADVVRGLRQKRSARWRASFRATQSRALLGLYASPTLPLPSIAVVHYD
jgi:hypothetical protein